MMTKDRNPKTHRQQDALRHKRLAVQLAAQLPEDHESAVAVLGYVRELLDTFLAPVPEKEPAEALKVISGSGTAA